MRREENQKREKWEELSRKRKKYVEKEGRGSKEKEIKK